MLLPTAADLEVRLVRTSNEQYVATTVLDLPEHDTPHGVSNVPVQINYDALRKHNLDDTAYGRALATMLFADPRLRDALTAARSAAQAQDLHLRLRLQLDPDDDALHALHWERLCDPQGDHLGLSERVRLSRSVISADATRYPLVTRRAVRALVVAAAPLDSRYSLAAFDATAVAAATAAALHPAQVETLDPHAGPVTLDRLAEALREQPDMLCLVCHGAIAKAEPLLYLEDAQGQADPVTATRLLEMLGALGGLPRLLVLLACDGASDASYTALSALGPRLARAGIPAVLAMQGKIAITSALTFLTSMITELHRHGQIDRAVAAARAGVRSTSDWWRPALFMRLISGQLWLPDPHEEPIFYETAPPFPLPDLFPPAETLIGRGGDLVELCNLFVQARRERKGQVAFITGQPGYGRAALARAVGLYAEEQGAAHLTLRFWPDARLNEWQRDALWAEDQLCDSQVPALEPQVAAAWPQAAAAGGAAWVRLVAQIAALLGHLPTPASERVPDSPLALAALLRSVAKRSAFSLSIEQVDYAPAPWPDLLRYLLPELRRDWPALLILTADAEQEPSTLPRDWRSEALEWALDLAEQHAADLRWLGPVDVAAVADYIAPAAPGIARRLHELGESCPSMIESIWDEWKEQGAVVWESKNEAWVADPQASLVYGRLRDQAHTWLAALRTSEPPDSISDALASKILACAALEGRAFTAQAVALALDLDAARVLDFCDSLIGDDEHPGLLEEVGYIVITGRHLNQCPNVYRFSYLYLWWVWRDYGPAPAERTALQARLAAALEQSYHPGEDRIAATLIQLYTAAGMANKAAPYRQRAVRTVDRIVLHCQVESLAALPQRSPMDDVRLYELRMQLSERIHEETGRYDEALRIDQAALEQALAWGDREREARSRHWVGVRYTFLGQPARALPELTQALKIRQTLLGPRHHSTATTLYALGRVHLQQSDYPAAKQYLQQALEIEQAVLGPQHPSTALTLHELGRVRYGQGNYPAAETYLQQALAILQAVRGPQHPSTASTLHALGHVHLQQSDYPAAEKYLQQALEIHQAVLGPQHPDTAATLHALGHVHLQQSDYPAAEAYLQQALAILQAVLGPQHPSTAANLQTLGHVHLKQGDYPAAEAYLQQALAIFQAVLGAQHPSTALTLRNLAFVQAKRRGQGGEGG
ncbi:NB-ARC domain-containing protein [Oscillochloris trichoides DG-6]|uniref:NB-ARC domain-containing protein n=1 Tax=Oscillochloris trichoides DG-6 TaxID=765420 RepID=E1IIL9_9CHLR|nr:tetratricopeptide repeat protein [Oscillochloris trichoides]EFO78969.1 NB-ARC domain-containing protein [Oscillochloris trichoides DG-6]